jgi:hypothetical protein
MECYRFYSLREVRQAAAGRGAKLALPADLLAATELLRDTDRRHVSLAAAKGEIRVSKARKAPQGRGRGGDAAFFWRYVFDSRSMQVLTDRPVTDFIQQ